MCVTNVHVRKEGERARETYNVHTCTRELHCIFTYTLYVINARKAVPCTHASPHLCDLSLEVVNLGLHGLHFGLIDGGAAQLQPVRHRHLLSRALAHHRVQPLPHVHKLHGAHRGEEEPMAIRCVFIHVYLYMYICACNVYTGCMY